MSSDGGSTVAELAYDAANRKLDTHRESVRIFRTYVSAVTSVAIATLTFLAKETVDRPKAPWSSTAFISLVVGAGLTAVLSLGISLFLLLPSRKLASGQTLESIVQLQDMESAAARLQVARAIDKSVRDGQDYLRCLVQLSLAMTITLLLSNGLWICALAQT